MTDYMQAFRKTNSASTYAFLQVTDWRCYWHNE